MSRAWGMPTWIFMHTLFAKMPDEKYVATDALSQIKALCSVLPCPDCAGHATTFMSTVTVKNVATRSAFQHVLWGFHNFVNARLHKPVFTFDRMIIYESLSLSFVYGVFLQEFTKPRNIPKLFMDSMSRARVVEQFKKWMLGLHIIGNPTRLAPIPNPAPVRAVTPMLGM